MYMICPRESSAKLYNFQSVENCCGSARLPGHRDYLVKESNNDYSLKINSVHQDDLIIDSATAYADSLLYLDLYQHYASHPGKKNELLTFVSHHFDSLS